MYVPSCRTLVQPDLRCRPVKAALQSRYGFGVVAPTWVGWHSSTREVGLFSHLLIQSFIFVWTHGYLSYILRKSNTTFVA